MAEKSRYNYRVEPQDVDFTLRATIPSLGGSILNTAGIDAHGKGFGVDALNADNHSWVLSRMAVEFDCQPTQYTDYTVATWISDYGRVLSTRNFTLTDAAGREFGRAVTQWAMIDLQSRSAIDLSWVGDAHADAIVDAAPADERAIFDLALSENIQREEMPPLDEAEAYKAAMQTLGGDAAAVAARFGKSEQYIYYRMKLNELIPDAKKLLRGNSITLGLAMELARYGKDLQKTICKDRLKDEEGWRKYSVKEFKRMVDAHYTNDLARYRFDRTACAACKYNANTYDMFATGSGRCTNRECLEAKNREFIERKSGELLAQNPKFILCKDRYGCDDHDKAVEHMTENGVECKAFEYGQVQEMPAMPAEPCPADYATDADYTVAMQIYEQQKKAAEEKTADLLAKHDAGAIRIFVKTSRDDARLVYVNQVTKGRESTGELIARLEEKKIRNTELAHEKTVEAVRQIVRDEEIAPTPFTQLEDNILYYIMLGSLRREHLAAVGFPEAYYLTSEQKIAVVNALTDEQRDLITRDFLVKSLTSDIGFDKTGKQLLMEFAALHHKEKYEVVKAQFDEEYTKRNDRLDERIAVAEAQEKAKTKAAKKEGKTGKSTKKTTKKAA